MKFTVLAASPSGCKLTRKTLSPDVSNAAGTPAVSAAAASLASTTFHCRSIATPGYGSWESSIRCSDDRTFLMAGSSIERCE